MVWKMALGSNIYISPCNFLYLCHIIPVTFLFLCVSSPYIHAYVPHTTFFDLGPLFTLSLLAQSKTHGFFHFSCEDFSLNYVSSLYSSLPLNVECPPYVLHTGRCHTMQALSATLFLLRTKNSSSTSFTKLSVLAA